MAVKTLDQVLSELQGTYQPQVDTLRQRQSAIPGQIAEEEKGLQAKQEQAFGDILGGARRRGLGFSGIPLSEQARYTSTEFLPAVARLRQSGQERAIGLEDAINQIFERRNTLAQQLVGQSYQQDLAERQFAEQQRQFNEQLAAQRRSAAASVANPTLNPGQPTQPGPRVVQSRPGSYSFFDSQDKPITAAQYAAATGKPLGDMLYEMAQKGDTGAAAAYNAFRNLRGPYTPQGKIRELAKQYAHIFGGV